MIKKIRVIESKKIPIYFVINGIFATIIHYCVFYIIYDFILLRSAGFSNLIASMLASFVSFLGNKYFVFQVDYDSVTVQATRFAALYLMIALFHGGFLLTWTDWLGWDYKAGFLLAVTFQTMASYFGNRKYVFRK